MCAQTVIAYKHFISLVYIMNNRSFFSCPLQALLLLQNYLNHSSFLVLFFLGAFLGSFLTAFSFRR